MNKILGIGIGIIIIIVISIFLNQKREGFNDLNYDIQEFENFLTPEECDAIVSLAEPHLFESKVYTDSKDIINKTRKSKQHWLRDHQHPVVKKISIKVAKMTSTSIDNQEPLQVVKYTKGGFFNPHHDACDGTSEFCERMNKDKGPRHITLLIYLNDNFEGGETEFPMISKKCIPKKGKAVLFYDTDSKGNILKKSLHGANPIKSGEKWVCNKWIKLGK